MNIISIIEHKRDKKELTKEEIEYFITEYTAGNILDYQASALIMAMYLNGMSSDETVNLTMAMADSGEKLNLADISNCIIDKHSTGGVGDKITIILMPLIAALGIPVAKMSGRGLGFTGGTADKLESIPGYNVNLTIDEFKKNIKNIGISLITSSMDLAPADKKIYALRDTIGCVSSIPLIASSVMSKKIAAGANKIVIDITCGNGAFMKTRGDGLLLAQTMIDIGNKVGREVRCILTDMNEPIGYAVGNQLEIVESVKALRGEMPSDVKEIVYSMATQILAMAGKAETFEQANEMIDNAISSGRAYTKFKELVEVQGGHTAYIDDINLFRHAKFIFPVEAKSSGYITEMNTEEIGRISSYIGAGRITKEDKIDFEAGILMNKKLGDKIEIGEPIAYIHTNMEDKIEESMKRLEKAVTIGENSIEKGSIIIEILK